MSAKTVLAGLVLYKSDRDLLSRCLRALLQQDLPDNIRLLLAFRDNDLAHDRQLLDELLAEFECEGRVAFRLEGENIGFGAGHNSLFAQSGKLGHPCDYYLCVNPDAVLHRDAVAKLVAFAARTGDRGLFEARQFPREHPKPYDPQTLETPWCSGCVLLIPAAVYERLGGFDPVYFMYCEDVDFSWRARAAGERCYTVAGALAHHYVGRSERDSSFERKHMVMSGYLLARKFQDSYFMQASHDEARQLLSEGELETLLGCKVTEIPRERTRELGLEFHNGFHFAAPRWSD